MFLKITVTLVVFVKLCKYLSLIQKKLANSFFRNFKLHVLIAEKGK